MMPGLSRVCRRAGRDRAVNCHIGAAIFASIFCGLAAAAPRPAFADTLPAQAAPSGFRSVDNGEGGRILDGSLPGVTSMPEAFRASLHRLSGYFAAGTLDIGSAVRSPDNGMTTAFFRAKLHGVPVTGMAIVAAGAQGGFRDAILFDTTARFAKTLPSLTKRLQTLPPPAATPTTTNSSSVALPPLHEQQAPDGTVGIRIPVDWQVVTLGSGRAIVKGPKKEVVNLNFEMDFLAAGSPRARNAEQIAKMTHTSVVTPVPIAAYTGDVAQDYVQGYTAYAQAHGIADANVHIDTVKPSQPGVAVVTGTMNDAGQERRFLGTARVTSLRLGAWSLTLWQISAPADEFPQVAPLMLAIEKSCTYNAQADRSVKAAETQAVIQSSRDAMATSKAEHDSYMAASQSRFDSWQATSRAQRDSMDRATAGWINYLRGSTVINETTTGNHGTVSNSVADFLADHFPGDFQVVPQSEYRKGVDY